VFLSASETHNRRNINKSIASTMDVFRDLVPAARQRGMRVRAYVSTVWGCPYEGNVDTRRVVDLARALLDMGCFEISLGDTLGIGTPLQTRRILAEVLSEIPASALAMHMHDTRGMALTSVTVGLEMGIRAFDTAIAGMGGCPYAPGASGNLATEDLIYMLHSLGIKTGVDLPKLMEAGQVAEAVVRRELPGRVHRAGLRSLNR
jgi:hydroxymethylglutaryl-CoA lyase